MKRCPFIVLFCLLCLLPTLKTNAQGSNDTVTVTPQKPTFLDSLHFNLYNAGHCCCTQYYSKNVSVIDTTIMLSYQYDDSLCMLCLCLAAGSHTLFACGPQKAGKYGIYKAESMYCPPGQVCPLGPVMIKRVGEVTVDVPTSSVREKSPIATGTISPITILRSSSGMILQLHIEKAQAVSAQIFSVTGEWLATILPKQNLSVGAHSIALDRVNTKNGIIIVHVKASTFSSSKIIKVTG